MPQLVQDTLLVVAPFRDATGFEYRAGDRASLRLGSVRQAALANPQWFAMEHAPVPVDVEWLRDLHERAEARYAEAMKERRARSELERGEELNLSAQARRASDKLEHRYQQEQAERKKRAEEMREQRERQRVEAVIGRSGFNIHP
jgi:hypothetical protein